VTFEQGSRGGSWAEVTVDGDVGSRSTCPIVLLDVNVKAIVKRSTWIIF